jgi:hypothetical protein
MVSDERTKTETEDFDGDLNFNLDFNHGLRQIYVNALKREMKDSEKKESVARPKDRWDERSYNGSSCFMPSEDNESVNLLASDDEGKENKKVGHSSRSMIPAKIEIPTQTGSDFKTQLSNEDDSDDDANNEVAINELVEQTVEEEREAKRKRLDNETKVQAMMDATAGYPGEEEVETQEIDPPQPEMGTVCVWCGEEPCEWSDVSPTITEYYRHEVETYGPEELPPHNIMRKRMYKQVARAQGFVRREKHPYCVHVGIRALSPSPDGNYMGHMDV